jgi:hypothetical protein
MMADLANRNSGAIVTAKAGEPLLHAERSKPVDPVDSGWQFSSHLLGGGDPDDIQIWAVHEVLAREPSLQSFIDLPCGTILHRRSASAEWQVGAS